MKGQKPILWRSISKKRDRLVRHILRQTGLIHSVTEETVEEKNARGSQILQYVKQIGRGNYVNREYKRLVGCSKDNQTRKYIFVYRI